MNFGASPGDLFAVANMAIQLYRRFKSAVPQFEELQTDLKSAEIVLNAIGELCQTEENLLSIPQEQELRNLVDTYRTSLLHLERFLEGNSRLERPNPRTISRLKWSQSTAKYHADRLQINLHRLSMFTISLILQQHRNHTSREHEILLGSIKGIRDELTDRMYQTEKLLTSKVGECQIPMPQDDQEPRVLQSRFSATVEEVTSHDLARQINMSIPKVSNTVDIVVSVLIPRAQEQSGTEKVDADVKLSPVIHNTGRPTKEVLSVQLEKRVKRRCPQSCACSCHPIRDLNSPNILVPFLGKAFLRYCRIAQSTGPCNISQCQNRILKYAKFTYVFPCWIMSRLVSVTFMGDPLMVIRSLRLVPTHSDSLRVCSINEVESLRLLFEKKVASPFDASAWDGRSLLHIAVNTMALGSCRFLIEQGAPCDFEDQYGATPSDMAWIKILGKQGNDEYLDMLKVLFPDDDPFFTFNFSEAHKSVFLEGGVRLESFLSSRLEKVDDSDRFGITALSWAARRGDDKSLIDLLNGGADPNICDVWGMAPIHFASNLANPKSIRQLVSWGADVNKVDGWGRNTFHYMTKTCSDTAFLEPIIEARIDFDHLEYWGKPPLHVATVSNNHQAVQYLLAKGAKTTYFDADKDSVMFEAVHHNSHEVLKILRDANADLGTVNRWGYSILHMAAIYADELTMDILNGMELNDDFLSLRSADGLTPAETFSKREAKSRSLDKAFCRLQKSVQARPQRPE